jgi:uncharacterized protein YjdB/plastocyanin
MNLSVRIFIYKIKIIKLKRKIRYLLSALGPAFAATMLIVGGLIVPVNPASAALQAVGSLSTVHGFPVYYQDTTGLALQLCLGVNPDGTGSADPNCVLPTAGPLEPNFPPPFNVTAPGGSFPGESFWYVADAIRIGVGAGTTNVKFRYALEAAFAADPPADGQQIAFLRVNLAPMAGLVPNATYTVTHPFGQFTATADALGVVPVSRFEDGAFGPPLTGATAASFLAAPTTNFGPFLRQVSPAPPAGYIGDAINESTIQSGPNGNFVRIDGPSIDTGNVDGDANPNSLTINTWVVAGKIAVIDTVAPVIGSTSPASVPLGSTNIAAGVNLTDNLFIGSVTLDLGPLGNELSATLNGPQGVPPSASPATGSGSFTINTAANTLSFNVNASGLVGGPIQAIHIHGPASAASSAPALFDLGNTLPATGVWNYPENVEADILAGRTYINIHTLLFTDLGDRAEIRGQILPATNIQNMVLISGTVTNGTWGVVIPSVTRLGIFNLPLTVSDGSNITNGNFVLTVNQLASVNVAPATAIIIATGTQQLTALPLDNNNNPFVGATITWSSNNPAAAIVNASGLVTGVAPGIATITVTATSGAVTVSTSSVITVVQAEPVLTSVSVTPNPATITVIPANPAGGTVQLTANALDQFGAPFNGATTTWFSDNTAVATVNATSGLVTSVATGTATITATAVSGLVNVSGTAVVNVVTGPVLTTINVTPATSTVVSGATKQFSAITLDQDGAPIAATPAWTSSNPAVATVNATSGLASAAAPGTTTISATGGTVSGSATMTVVAPVLTSMSISPASPSLIVGGTLQLAAAGADQFGGALTLTGTTTWSSSNGTAGSVNATGLFTALSSGSTIVSATNGSTTASATITVNAVPAAGGGSGGGGGGGGGLSQAVIIPASQLKTSTTTIQKIEDKQKVLGEKIESPADRGPELKGIRDPKLEERLKGRILLQIESSGQAWYLGPVKKQRVFLGRPADAFRIMREHGLGITNADLVKIAVAGDNRAISSLARQLAGRIVLQVQAKGEAYYINPLTFKRHFLGRPADAFRIMRELALGISNNDLAKITAAEDSSSKAPVAKTGETKTFTMSAKRFDFTPGEITVNRGDKVVIKLASTDAEHGIRIDQFGINQAVKAGETAEIQFIADKSGTFEFRCPVPCGTGHSEMRGKLIVI